MREVYSFIEVCQVGVSVSVKCLDNQRQTLYFCYQETRGDERLEKREVERKGLERFRKEKSDSQIICL